MDHVAQDPLFDPLTGRVSMHWEGKDVADHSLDVRVFGAALIDMADVIERAVQVLNTDEHSVVVKVQSDFKSGSFNAELAVWVMMGHQALLFLNSNSSLGSIPEILGLLFDGAKAVTGKTVGLVSAVRALGTDRVDKFVKSDDPTKPVVLYRKTEQLEVDPGVFALLTDPQFREKFGKLIIDSMSKPGISQLRLTTGATTEPLVITHDDVHRISPFVPALPTPILSDDEPHVSTPDLWLHVDAAVFKGVTQWKFTAGKQSFAAKIKDKVFNDKISRGEELFGAGDSILAAVRITQEVKPGKKPKTTYEIMKVHKHVHPPKPSSLF
jgi:hypothetical protein